MPTEAERNGDFSNTYDTRGRKVYIRDPPLESALHGHGPERLVSNNIIPRTGSAGTRRSCWPSPLPTVNCVAACNGVGTCPLTNVTSGNPYNYSIFAPREEPSTRRCCVRTTTFQTMAHVLPRIDHIQENRGLTSTTNKHQWGSPPIIRRRIRMRA